MNIYREKSYIMAPIAGYSDWPFRKAIRKLGCHYAFTQMIDAGSLVWGMKCKRRRLNGKNTLFMHRAPEEEWLGIQLLGNDPDLLEEAVEIINERNYDVLDLNMGCPVRKVIKRQCGAKLAEDEILARKCLEKMVKKSKIPVTAKIRILDIDDPEPSVYLALELEKAGISALTVHGRTRSAIYSGSTHYNIIREISNALTIPVIVNGGIMSTADAQIARDKSKCDSAMIARGAIGNPWIFKELYNEKTVIPTPEQLCNQIEEHINDIIDFYGEEIGMKISRKILLSYLMGRGYRGEYRNNAGRIKTMDEFNIFMKLIRSKGPDKRYIKKHRL
ncbi:MAG: tRNA-dihydrouridine synthase family protein [Verrucomicrobiota bacterium]|nr:tRNA-dihydrouridine synthase family protein [Verrucomicrobiota bacterium]